MVEFFRTKHGASLAGILFLCLLFAIEAWFGPTLLSPLPRSWLIATLVVGLPLPFYLAWNATAPITIRLLHRPIFFFILTVLGIGTEKLGEAVFVFAKFSGQVSQSIEKWPVAARKPDTDDSGAIEVYHAGEPSRAIPISATPDAVKFAEYGKCVAIAVDRNALGDAKLASVQRALRPESVVACESRAEQWGSQQGPQSTQVATNLDEVSRQLASQREQVQRVANARNAPSSTVQDFQDQGAAARIGDMTASDLQRLPFGGLGAASATDPNGVTFAPGQPMVDSRPQDERAK